jgi:hypothetical protein
MRNAIYLFSAALMLSANFSMAAEPLNVAIAQADITPPVGYRMSGYFYERLSTGANDPLYAKAIVLRQGDEQAALVFCDLVGMSRAVTDAARQAASEKTKIPREHILIAATHSHTGPLYFGALRDYFHEQAVARHGSDPAEKVDYPAFLTQQLVAAITEAQQKLQPATLTPGVAELQGVSFNRRFHMKDGSVRFNPGRKNPDIVRVAGPIDPLVHCLEFENAKTGRAIGMLTVFALHLDTVGGTEYSGDYPHYLAQAAGDAISVFGAGTCGDINHIDVTRDDQPKGQEMAAEIGAKLLQAAGDAIRKSGGEVPTSLAVKQAVVECPLQHYPANEIAKARVNMAKIGTRELSFLEQVETYKIVALQSLPKDKLPLEVQAFRLSDDVALVGLPGEIFVELGLAIQAQSPFKNTIVIELCNDTPGYVPTRKAFAEGSYETVNSRVEPGGGEMLVDAAVKLLKALK